MGGKLENAGGYLRFLPMWNLEEIENTQIFCHNLLALFYWDPTAALPKSQVLGTKKFISSSSLLAFPIESMRLFANAPCSLCAFLVNSTSAGGSALTPKSEGVAQST
jgi:hypothetical protein